MFFQDVAGQARYGKVGSALYTDGSDRFFGTMTSALLALRHDVDRDGSQEHQTLDGLHDCGIDTHDGQALVDDAHHEGADNSTGDGADATGYRSTANEAGRDGVHLEFHTGLRGRGSQSGEHAHCRDRR